MKNIPENTPEAWIKSLPTKGRNMHKYNAGHALVYGASKLTGASRLAAEACARTGVGLVTVLAQKNTGDIYRTSLPAHILVRDDMTYTNDKVTAKLYGPGGVSAKPDYTSSLPTILDADALKDLPENLSENFILTPHEGEFKRAFSHLNSNDRLEKARAASQEKNCHIILKGPETIIAAPDGKAVINTHASPWLASAGTGDVLAGLITGLVAQGMPIFEACCAAVWIHGECGIKSGPYLVASDLINHIQKTLSEII